MERRCKSVDGGREILKTRNGGRHTMWQIMILWPFKIVIIAKYLEEQTSLVLSQSDWLGACLVRDNNLDKSNV